MKNSCERGKMLGNYRVTAQLVASRVVLSSTELIRVRSFVHSLVS
jgi:hypothetical protein